MQEQESNWQLKHSQVKDAITIREFQFSDIGYLTELTNTLGYATTIEQMTKRMEKIVQLGNYWTFVALLDERVVGYMGLNENHFWEQDGTFIRIQALVVAEKYRRANVGRKLIETAEKLARQSGAKVILLNCGSRPERQAAHRFYVKSGFEPKSTGYVRRLA